MSSVLPLARALELLRSKKIWDDLPSDGGMGPDPCGPPEEEVTPALADSLSLALSIETRRIVFVEQELDPEHASLAFFGEGSFSGEALAGPIGAVVVPRDFDGVDFDHAEVSIEEPPRLRGTGRSAGARHLRSFTARFSSRDRALEGWSLILALWLPGDPRKPSELRIYPFVATLRPRPSDGLLEAVIDVELLMDGHVWEADVALDCFWVGVVESIGEPEPGLAGSRSRNSVRPPASGTPALRARRRSTRAHRG